MLQVLQSSFLHFHFLVTFLHVVATQSKDHLSWHSFVSYILIDSVSEDSLLLVECFVFLTFPSNQLTPLFLNLVLFSRKQLPLDPPDGAVPTSSENEDVSTQCLLLWSLYGHGPY